MKGYDYEPEEFDDNDSKRRKLYRLPKKGKIAGVCAGFADFFGYESWVVRLIAVTGVFMGGPLFICAYIVLWFALDVEPSQLPKREAGQDKYYRPGVSEVWRAGNEPKQAVKDLDDIFNTLENRLARIEKYVTSKRYNLDREFSKMQRDA